MRGSDRLRGLNEDIRKRRLVLSGVKEGGRGEDLWQLRECCVKSGLMVDFSQIVKLERAGSVAAGYVGRKLIVELRNSDEVRVWMRQKIKMRRGSGVWIDEDLSFGERQRRREGRQRKREEELRAKAAELDWVGGRFGGGQWNRRNIEQEWRSMREREGWGPGADSYPIAKLRAMEEKRSRTGSRWGVDRNDPCNMTHRRPWSCFNSRYGA